MDLVLSGAAVLLMVQLCARVGLDRRALSASEAFVLGHWPFIWLNLLIISLSGGVDWGSADRMSRGAVTAAAGVVLAGLLSFVAGNWLASRASRSSTILRLPRPRASEIAVAGLALVALGGAATLINTAIGLEQGPRARLTALLALSHLLVPGILLLCCVARERAWPRLARLGAAAVALAGATLTAVAWSRKYVVVVAGAWLLLGASVRRGYPPRRRALIMVPIFALIAVVGLMWRTALWYPGSVTWQALTSVPAILDEYSRSIWLESSAFSALVLILSSRGPWSFLGGGSMLAAFVFWIPRSVLPSKPEAFDFARGLGMNYSVAPSLYGEALANFTVIGVLPVLFAVGWVLKLVDRRSQAGKTQPVWHALYLLFVFDCLFLVRGSFHTMVMPILIHCVFPMLLLAVLVGMRRLLGASIRREGT